MLSLLNSFSSKQQLSTMTNQMQEAMESNESLKNELSALKASGGGAGAMEKLAEKDHLLEQRKREIDQLEVSVVLIYYQ